MMELLKSIDWIEIISYMVGFGLGCYLYDVITGNKHNKNKIANEGRIDELEKKLEAVEKEINELKASVTL